MQEPSGSLEYPKFRMSLIPAGNVSLPDQGDDP